MFKIRPGCFETNSSSMDSYSDIGGYGDYAYANQLVYIVVEWAEGTTEERKDEVREYVNGNGLDDEIESILYDMIPAAADNRDFELDIFQENEITFLVPIEARSIMTSSGYRGDRYNPPEGAEYTYEYDGAAPLKGSANTAAVAKAKEQLLKMFKEAELSEIVAITTIYGTELCDDDFE